MRQSSRSDHDAREGGRATWLTVAAAAISVAVFAFGIYRFVGSRRALTHLHDTSGSEVNLVRGRWYALFVGSVEDDAPIIHALQQETAHRGPSGPPVTGIVLATDLTPVIQQYVNHSQPTMAVVPVESNQAAMGAALNTTDDHRQLLLVNPSGEVVFRGLTPRVTDVKLLLDRFVPLPIAQKPPPPLAVGDELLPPSSKVMNIRTDRPEQPSSPMLWIVFTGRCTTCALNTYLKMTHSVESALIRRAEASRVKAAVVFTSYFSPPRVREQLETLDFKMPAYQVTSDMPGVDQLALRDSADVLVIQTDSGGRVITIASLDTFIRELVH